jgi:hypothetical protein
MNSTTEKLSNGNSIHYVERNGTAYHAGMDFKDGTKDVRGATPDAIISALESARLSGAHVRMFYGDEHGRDWCEEWEVSGTIGRSTGRIKIPLIIKTSRSSGGPAILDNCIVRLLVNGCEVYRQSNYQLPVFRVRPIAVGESCGGESLLSLGLTAAVDRLENGKWGNQANFKNASSAQRYVDFMTGKRLKK